LNPTINIWEVAQPVVSRYIAENVGPKALLRDLVATARVLGKFGPKLPQLAEAALIRQTALQSPPPPERSSIKWQWFALGAGSALLGVLAAHAL
jgi:ubiquinone biosynthesis protein